METSNYPQFIPLSTAANFINTWNCDLGLKTNSNTYYKCLEGYGQIQLINNCKYKGQIKNGLYQGQGVFQWPNGTIYQGDFKKSKITGFGVLKWTNGNYYKGQFSNGQKQGQGTFYSAVQNFTYIGTWKNGKKEGKGKLQYKDQSCYVGNFKNDKKQGYGKMTYSSKNQYEGQWKNDKKHGKGTMNWFNPHQKYVGQWKDDYSEGYGEYYWLQNKTEYKILKHFYKGSWKKGKRQGFGSFFFSNGYRFQGYFYNNLKQGLGITIDEQGFGKLQVYTNNRPISLTSRNMVKTKQQKIRQNLQNQSKLPKIGLKKLVMKTQIQGSSPPPNRQSTNSHSTHMAQNVYKNYIDFQHPQINDNFYNMLLRHNSELRNIYKVMGTSNSQYRQFYSGMVLQNYWKMLRQTKLLSQTVSIVAIDRQFSKGQRSIFSLNMPNSKIIQILSQNILNLDDINYQNIIWQNGYRKLLNETVLNWQQFTINTQHKQCKQICSINKQTIIDIHHPSNIILYRHFICLIIHTTLLLDDNTLIISNNNNKSLKDRVQSFINILNHYIETINKNDKNQKGQDKDNCTFISAVKSTVVPQWVKNIHQQLVYQIQKQNIGYQGKLDISIPVRKMYSMLELSNVFKDVNQKIVYLERIQKYLNIKSSAFKKQNKNYYADIERNIKLNPIYNNIMNYELNIKQFNQFLFLSINKKINASNQQDFQNKYKQTIKNMINQVKARNTVIPFKKLKLKKVKIQSQKDRAKKQLFIDFELAKKKQLQQQEHQRQMKREERQRKLMRRQDHDAQVLESSIEEDNQYYK